MGDTELIHRRYRLLEQIGSGGMGRVWRAHDEALGRLVAVKTLKPPGVRHDPGFLRVLRERFRREARVAAALQHHGVTVVHDFGEDGDVLYLVMELLDGRNLSELLDSGQQDGGRPLPVPDVMDIAAQLLTTLAYTHRQGVVHRDLKPANIMRLADGTVKICDFGIARLGHDIGFTSRLTGNGVAMGTPHYMSPEQIAGSQLDHRSDLYSLGCVLYELSTGAPPFDLGDAWGVLVGHRDTEPEPPRARRPELPRPIDRLIMELLTKDPARRPADAAALVAQVMAAPPSAPGTAHHGRLFTHATPWHQGAAAPTPATAAAPFHEAPALPGWARVMSSGPLTPAARPWLPAPAPVPELTRRWTGDRPATSDAHAQSGRHTPYDDTSRPGNPAGHTAPPVAGEPEPTDGGWRTSGEWPVAPPEVVAQLASRHHAGLSLGRLGRWDEAYTAHRAVAGERERVLGPDHPATLTSGYEMAYALGQLGRWEEALAGYQWVVRGRQRALGPDHPDVFAARYEAGISLGRLGRSGHALRLYRELAADRARAQGATHPETLRARHGVGVNLGRLGHWEEALAEAWDVCAHRERVLGTDHPDTSVSRREVAVALGWLGRWQEALAVYRRVTRDRERILGLAHPDALTSRNDEAQCLERLGRSAEAAELYRRAAMMRDPGSPTSG